MKFKTLLILGLLFVSIRVSPVLAQNTVNLPSAAHSTGATAGYYVDPDTGKKVYRLSDRTLCPGGASHFYSYSNQFSIAGDMVFDCRAANTNYVTYPIYDSNFKLLYTDALSASGAPAQSYRMVQWSQSRRVLFAQQGTRIWEFDPFNGTARQIGDFGGKSFTTSSGGTMTVGGAVALSVGPGDRLMVHIQPVGNYSIMAIGTFEVSTGRYSFLGVPVQGQVAPQGFDEATYSQDPNGRVTLQNAYASGYTYASNLTSPAKYDDNNGHRGFFCGSNGRCYKVNVKNDTLPNGVVAQLGCPAASPWIPEHALYNDVTGKRELIWSCDMPASSNLRKAMAHFSRSLANNVFFGSGEWIARYQVSYDGSGNPNQVTGALVATTRTNAACGYWSQPRANSNPAGDRALFDSSMSDATYISKENGSAKTSCTIDVYVADAGGGASPPPPPPPSATLSVTPGSVSFAAVIGSNPTSQNVQVTTSSSTTSWTVSSNQGWLRPSVGSGTGSRSVTLSITTSGLLSGSYNGTVTFAAGGTQATVNVSLSLNGGSGVASLSMSPNPITGPNSSTGTVTIGSAAPSGGAAVLLSDNSGAVSVPGSVTVPAGQTRATFNASAAQVAQRTQVTISASYNGSVQAVLIVDPPVSAITASPTSLSFTTNKGFNPSSRYVLITAPSSLAWTAKTNQIWLRTSVGNGRGSYRLNIWLTCSSLGIGTYNGVVTISSGSGPVNIPVSLTVK